MSDPNRRSITLPDSVSAPEPPAQEPTEGTLQEPQLPKGVVDLNIFKKKTLGELGKQLPIGMVGVPNRGFAFKRYTLDEEIAIAEFKKNKRNTIGYYIARILSYMLTDLCGQNFSEMKEPEKILMLSRLYAADVLYMYFWLRIEGMGELMDWEMKCPRCDKAFTFESNFNTMEVFTVETPIELVWEYATRHGFQLGDKLYKTLRLKSPNWGVYDTTEFKGEMNPAAATATILRSSILAADGESIGLVDATLRKGLHKYDYEHISRFMDQRVGGPELKLEMNCPRCELAIAELVPWMDPDFLSRTSFKGSRLMG